MSIFFPLLHLLHFSSSRQNQKPRRRRSWQSPLCPLPHPPPARASQSCAVLTIPFPEPLQPQAKPPRSCSCPHPLCRKKQQEWVLKNEDWLIVPPCWKPTGASCYTVSKCKLRTGPWKQSLLPPAPPLPLSAPHSSGLSQVSTQGLQPGTPLLPRYISDPTSLLRWALLCLPIYFSPLLSSFP